MMKFDGEIENVPINLQDPTIFLLPEDWLGIRRLVTFLTICAGIRLAIIIITVILAPSLVSVIDLAGTIALIGALIMLGLLISVQKEKSQKKLEIACYNFLKRMEDQEQKEREGAEHEMAGS